MPRYRLIIGAAFAAAFCFGHALGQVARPAPEAEVSKERLLAELRALPVSRSGAGDEQSVANLRALEQTLFDKLKALGYEPAFHEFQWASFFRPRRPDPDADKPADAAAPDSKEDPAAPQPTPTWRNVIAEIRGSELPHEVIVLGAHFDAVPQSPGADDNGTGTSALLELARVLKDRPLKRTVRFCFFNLEENGCIGSSRYYTDWRKSAPVVLDRPERIVGMVSLEMLGFFSDLPGSQKSPIKAIEGVFEPPTVGDTICITGVARDKAFINALADAMKAAAPGLKVTVVDFLPVPIPDILRSDHRAFLLGGVPAVMLTDTANFRNPHYHMPTDTVETLDHDRYTLVVRGVAGAVVSLANGGDEPFRPAAKPAPAPEKR